MHFRPAWHVLRDVRPPREFLGASRGGLIRLPFPACTLLLLAVRRVFELHLGVGTHGKGEANVFLV